MRKRTLVVLVSSIVASCLLGVGLYLFVIFDPFEWGVVQSHDFTWEKFASVKPGEPIDSVITKLGKPVREPSTITIITTDPGDPCTSGGCKKYLFAGARWGASFKEAIVIVDPNGRVLNALARQE
jgi:hypothetical protein